jgi:hypothetical protein
MCTPSFDPDPIPVPRWLGRIWEIGLLLAIGTMMIWGVLVALFIAYVVLGGAAVLLFS